MVAALGLAAAGEATGRERRDAVVERAGEIDHRRGVDVHRVAARYFQRITEGVGREETLIEVNWRGAAAGGHAGFVVAEYVREWRYGIAQGIVIRVHDGRKARRGQIIHRRVAHRCRVVAVAHATVQVGQNVALHRGIANHHSRAVIHHVSRAGAFRQQRQGLSGGGQATVQNQGPTNRYWAAEHRRCGSHSQVG